MPELTLTAQPDNEPPAVEIRVDADPDTLIQNVVVRRDGQKVRGRIPDRVPTLVLRDTEMAYETEVEYTVEGDSVPTDDPMVDEDWDDLGDWAGDTGDWEREPADDPDDEGSFPYLWTRVDDSTIELAEPTDLPFNTVTVRHPVNVRMELIEFVETDDGPDEEHVCATVTTSETGTTLETDAGVARTNATGTFTLFINDERDRVELDGDGWGINTGGQCDPTMVRFTSGPDGHHHVGDLDYQASDGDRIAASDDSVFILDLDGQQVRVFDPDTLTETDSWGVEGAVDVTVNGSRVYTLHEDGTVTISDQSGTVDDTVTLARGSAPVGSLLAVGNFGDDIYVWHNTESPQALMRYNTSGQETWGDTYLGQAGALELAADLEGRAVWALAGNGRIYKYSTVSNLPSITSWATDAVSFDVATDAPRTKYELWGNQVRLAAGVGNYQPGGWQATGSQIAINYTGNIGYIIDDNAVRVYAPQTRIGPTTVVAVLSDVGEPFMLSDTIELTVDSAWLIHPSNPSQLSVRIGANHECPRGCNASGIAVSSTSRNEVTHEANVTEIEPPGRRRKIINRFGQRRLPDWDLVLILHDLISRDRLAASISDQNPLLLRVPESWGWDLPDGWYHVADAVEARLTEDSLVYPRRMFTFPLTPADPPVVVDAPEWNYNSVLEHYVTMEALEQSGDTWLQVLTGDVSVSVDA